MSRIAKRKTALVYALQVWLKSLVLGPIVFSMYRGAGDNVLFEYVDMFFFDCVCVDVLLALFPVAVARSIPNRKANRGHEVQEADDLFRLARTRPCSYTCRNQLFSDEPRQLHSVLVWRLYRTSAGGSVDVEVAGAEGGRERPSRRGESGRRVDVCFRQEN